MATEEWSQYIPVIRRLLLAAFQTEQLRPFLEDRPPLRPIVNSFGPGQGLDDMVDKVIGYCDKNVLFIELLAGVKEVNPRQYARFESELPEFPPDFEPAALPCPYRGLEPFEAEHARFYFGRDDMVERLVAQVKEHRFVAVVGPSGCGKSSLVRAGLVTELRQGALDGSRDWAVHIFRPGKEPLRALSAPLVALLEPKASEVDRMTEIGKLADRLRAGTLSLADVATRLGEVRADIPRLVLVIDQFEELYTECEDESLRQAFLDALLAAEDQNVTVVLTLRADFYGHVLADRRLGQAVDAGVANVLPMSEEELQAAIEEPAHLSGRSFEPGLVRRILDDVTGEPGNLPLLEFALWKLCEKQIGGTSLTHETYDAIGRVQGAIAQHAEEVYKEQEKQDREQTVQRIFLRLTHYGEGAEGTRRQAVLDDLITPLTPRQEVLPVLKDLADARLVVTSAEVSPETDPERAAEAGPAEKPVEAAGTVTVEVAHEALIRGWERLQRWLADDRAFGLWREKLARARQIWEETGQDQDALLRGTTLSEAEGWLVARGDDLNEAERAFIQRGQAQRKQEEEERQAQQRRKAQLDAERRTAGRLRTLAVGLGVSVLIAMILAGLALFLRQQAIREGDARATAQVEAETEAWARATAQVEAESQRDQAEAARREADALKLAFASQSQLEQNHELALLLAIEARRAGPSLEADTALWAWFNHPGRTLQILAGHAGEVTRAAWSPDGRRIVTASEDGTARVWDAATGQELAQLAGHEGGVARVAWSPGGDRILTAGCDQLGEPGECVRSSARVWHVPSWQKMAVFEGHSGWVWDAAWSPDGRHVVTSGQDGLTRLYDAGSWAELAVLEGHEAGVRAVAWSPDGGRIVTASFDNNARLWDVSNVPEMGTAGLAQGAILEGHTDRLLSVAWSPDGGRIVTSSGDSTARVWDAEDGAELAVLQHEDTVWHAAWDGDGRHIVTGSNDGTARIWPVPLTADEGQQVEPTQILEHGAEVRVAAWDVPGRRIVTAGNDGTARIWDADTGAPLATLTGHQGAVSYAGWDAGDGRLVTASSDHTARVWTGEGGIESAVLRGHKAAVFEATWDPGGRQVLTTSADQSARVWDPWAGSQQPLTRATLGPLVAYATWARDGQHILTAGWDGKARTWDASTGTELTALGDIPLPLTEVTWADAGRRIIGLSMDGTLRVWDATTRSELAVLQAPPGLAPQAASWSADRQRLVVTGLDGTVHLADLSGILDPDGDAGGGLRALPDQAGEANYAALSPDGRWLATAGKDAIVRVWDVSTASGEGEPLVLTGHSEEVWHIAWDPEGRRLVTSSKDDTARVWDAESGALLALLQGHKGAVVHAAWSPDGHRIVTGSNDGTARLWDATTGQNLAILTGHTALVAHVAWDGQGQYLVTASYDGTARIYFTGFEDMVALACERAVRNLSTNEWEHYLGDEPTRQTCPGKLELQAQP